MQPKNKVQFKQIKEPNLEITSCPFCKVSMRRNEMAHHYQQECLEVKRLFTRCLECNVLVRNEDIKVHLNHFCKMQAVKTP